MTRSSLLCAPLALAMLCTAGCATLPEVEGRDEAATRRRAVLAAALPYARDGWTRSLLPLIANRGTDRHYLVAGQEFPVATVHAISLELWKRPPPPSACDRLLARLEEADLSSASAQVMEDGVEVSFDSGFEERGARGRLLSFRSPDPEGSDSRSIHFIEIEERTYWVPFGWR